MSNDNKTSKSFKTFVPALPQRQEIAPVSTHYPIVDVLPTATHIAPIQQSHDAMMHAKATLLVSTAYVAAAGLITTGLLLLAWLFRALGDAWGLYVYGGLIAWGLCILVALWANRRQSLHHSPSGLVHHEIDSRERVALHAIDTHADLLLKRWEMDHDDK